MFNANDSPQWLALLGKQVELAFSKEAPNGYLLGWDSNRYFSDFTRLVQPHACRNQTTFDYQFCTTFALGLRQNSSELCLTLLMSFIAPVASIHWTEKKPNWKHPRVVPPPVFAAAMEQDKNIQKWLTGLGFGLLTSTQEDTPVRVTTLELCEGQATIGRCLFYDFA